MALFPVYPLLDLTFTAASGSLLTERNGDTYLDLYGGHAVISIGHTHAHYTKRLTDQLHAIGFYSNSVQIPIQEELSKKLQELSGYHDYSLFMCNSGAEANENAIKLASFQTGKKKIISFSKAFHGRTAAAVAATDNKKIVAPVNESEHFMMLPFNDVESLREAFKNNDDIAGVIIEGIQGVGGVHIPTTPFLKEIEQLCLHHNAVFILDEVQSGHGRSGKFFAHQHAAVTPDIITMAKGMGNGFPVGGILISPKIEASFGLLGTTFGGNHLACAASLSVLEVIESEKLLEHSAQMGDWFVSQIKDFPHIIEVRHLGLMIGIQFDQPIKEIRTRLIQEFHILTGTSSCPNTLRILPALNVSQEHLQQLVNALNTILNS